LLQPLFLCVPKYLLLGMRLNALLYYKKRIFVLGANAIMSPRVTEQHKENRREQILEAAGRCFARRGYAQTTMQGIFADAGLSAGAIYSYFKSKSEIYMALTERDLQADLRRYADAIASGGATAWERLHGLVERCMANFTDPDQEEFVRLYLLEFLPASATNPELALALRRRNEQLQSLLVQVLREGIAAGQFRPLDPEAAAALILAAADGVRLHAVTFGTLAGARAMYETYIANLKTVVGPG
jgi:AcrR family transcriptional regulator